MAKTTGLERSSKSRDNILQKKVEIDLSPPSVFILIKDFIYSEEFSFLAALTDP